MADSNIILEFLNFVSKYLPSLGFTREFAQGPAILYNLLIPLVLLIVALKFAFDQIRIFNSGVVNWGLSILIAFASLMFVNIGFITLIFPMLSILFISLFSLRGTKGLVIGIVLAALYGFVLYPFMVVNIR